MEHLLIRVGRRYCVVLRWLEGNITRASVYLESGGVRRRNGSEAVADCLEAVGSGAVTYPTARDARFDWPGINLTRSPQHDIGAPARKPSTRPVGRPVGHTNLTVPRMVMVSPQTAERLAEGKAITGRMMRPKGP